MHPGADKKMARALITTRLGPLRSYPIAVDGLLFFEKEEVAQVVARLVQSGRAPEDLIIDISYVFVGYVWSRDHTHGAYLMHSLSKMIPLSPRNLHVFVGTPFRGEFLDLKIKPNSSFCRWLPASFVC